MKIEWSQEWEDIEHIYEFNFMPGNELDVTTLQPDGKVMHTSRPIAPSASAASTSATSTVTATAEVSHPVSAIHASPSLQPVGASTAGSPPLPSAHARHESVVLVKSPDQHPTPSAESDSTGASTSTDLPPPITIVTNMRARSRSTIMEDSDAVLSPLVTSLSELEEPQPPIMMARRSSVTTMSPSPDNTPVQQKHTSPTPALLSVDQIMKRLFHFGKRTQMMKGRRIMQVPILFFFAEYGT